MKLLRTVRFVVCRQQDETVPQHRVRFHNFHWCYKLEDGTWVYEERDHSDSSGQCFATPGVHHETCRLRKEG